MVDSCYCDSSNVLCHRCNLINITWCMYFFYFIAPPPLCHSFVWTYVWVLSVHNNTTSYMKHRGVRKRKNTVGFQMKWWKFQKPKWIWLTITMNIFPSIFHKILMVFQLFLLLIVRMACTVMRIQHVCQWAWNGRKKFFHFQFILSIWYHAHTELYSMWCTPSPAAFSYPFTWRRQ